MEERVKNNIQKGERKIQTTRNKTESFSVEN